MDYPLEQIQRWMQAVLMHPGGVAAGAESADARQHIDLASGQIDEVVRPSSTLDATERLEIYARAYYARLVECLEAEFPLLAKAVGEELFQEFAVGYLERYPSRSYTLNRLGARFAEYLAQTLAADDDPGAESADAAASADSEIAGSAEVGPAFLIDLARLEWAFGEVFDGPGAENSALLAPEELAGIDPSQWADLRLVPVPCLRIVELDWPVQDYYRRLRAEADAPPPAAAAKTRLAVTRRDYVVRHYPLGPTQMALLQAILAGATIGSAIQRALEVGEFDPQSLARPLGEWFRFWSSEGFFLAVQ